MNDRDTFAAAALTGLLANGDYSVESTPLLAYRMADAMLRERGTAVSEPPHATPTQGSVPSEGSVPDSRTENEPVAWAVIGKERMAGHVIGLHDTVLEARSRVGRMVSYGDIYTADKVEIVPLYRQPQPKLTDEEQEAIEAAIIGGCEMADTLRKLLERLK